MCNRQREIQPLYPRQGLVSPSRPRPFLPDEQCTTLTSNSAHNKYIDWKSGFLRVLFLDFCRGYTPISCRKIISDLAERREMTGH